MNLKAKAPLPLIVLTVLILISSALAGAGFYLYKKELGLNLKLQADLESTKTKLNVTERRFEEAQKKSECRDSDPGRRSHNPAFYHLNYIRSDFPSSQFTRTHYNEAIEPRTRKKEYYK